MHWISGTTTRDRGQAHGSARADAGTSRRGRARAHRILWFWGVALCAGAPGAARAQLHALPYADADYEYNSNLFALPSSAPLPTGGHGSGYSDREIDEHAGVEALYDWGLQEFYANLEGRHFGYENYTELDHDEYLIHAGLKWKLLDLLDGVVDYRHERSMVPFLDFTATTLYLQAQSLTTASANLQITPDWRLESQGIVNDLDSPRPGYAHLSLTEDSVHEGLRYVGLARVSAGIDAIYLQGHFNGDEFVVAPRYDQTTVEAAAKYVATGLSSFHGSLGYTRREQERAGTIGGTTGLLAYQRQISEQTSFDVQISRALNSYVTYGSTEIDTGAALEATWNVTDKIAIGPRYQWTYSTFPDVNLSAFSASGPQRREHYQLATLSIKYQVLNWLSLRPFAQYETRRSDVGLYSFNRTLYGLEFELRLSGQADQPYQLTLPDLL
jgi:hypothetical protein